MKPQDLADLASRTNWNKHLVIWVGRRAMLDEILANTLHTAFDVLDLFDEDESLPSDELDRREEVERRLEARLREHRPSSSKRMILRVENAAILARWGISLQAFFDYFIGSHTMAILCLEGAMPTAKWSPHLQQEIEYDPRGTLRYLTSCLADPSQVYTECV
jgi:hypothetical protein